MLARVRWLYAYRGEGVGGHVGSAGAVQQSVIGTLVPSQVTKVTVLYGL